MTGGVSSFATVGLNELITIEPSYLICNLPLIVMNEMHSPHPIMKEQGATNSGSENMSGIPRAGLESDSKSREGSYAKKDFTGLGVLMSLPFLLVPAGDVSAEAAAKFFSPDSQDLEQPMLGKSRESFRLDQHDPLFEVEKIELEKITTAQVVPEEEDGFVPLYELNAAALGAFEMFNTKGEYEFLSQGGLSSRLDELEIKLSLEVLSREQNCKLMTEVIDTVRARVIECGTAAGWSKSHCLELADAIVAIGKNNSSCAGLLKTLNNQDAPVPSQDQLINAVTAMRSFTADVKIVNFGLEWYAFKTGIVSLLGNPNHQENACGPIALYCHLQLKRGDNREICPKRQQKLFDDLYRELSPGTFGTSPSRLADAVKNVTKGEFQLDLKECNNWSEARKIIDSTIESEGSCVVKYGSSLFAQHYDCIVGALEINGIRLYLSTSGYMISANRLAEMMSQKPYSNHIWIAQPSRDESLPEIDRNAEMRRFSRG